MQDLKFQSLARAFSGDLEDLIQRTLRRLQRNKFALPIYFSRILNEGTLSERIVQAAGPKPTRPHLRAVYRRLADCLQAGLPFREDGPRGGFPSL